MQITMIRSFRTLSEQAFLLNFFNCHFFCHIEFNSGLSCCLNGVGNYTVPTTRALTNTVGGEYEYIHEYRVTKPNTNIRRTI